MKLFKRLILWLAFGAVAASLEVYAFDRLETAQAQTNSIQAIPANYRISHAEMKELEIMRINLDHGSGVAWRAAMSHVMLIKANWLANRLNLPISRPIQTSDVHSWDIEPPWDRVLCQYPAWFPDTVFGTNLYNTNFSRLQRILALKFGVEGVLDTPAFEFSFNNGQLTEILRADASQGERHVDRTPGRSSEATVQPSIDKNAEVYQLATQWLAAVDVNLIMLEKSRLSQPVHQAEYQPDGTLLPQTVYFVDWGTNYYGLDSLYKTWHTNEWHPAVTVEMTEKKELLKLYIGDPTFFRNPPMLIPSRTVWQLVHTPDPPLQYLRTPAGMREFVMTPEQVSDYASHITNRLWLYEHHQLDSTSNMQISNYLKTLNSELIPYTPYTNDATP